MLRRPGSGGHQDRRRDAAVRHLCRHRPAGALGPGARRQGGQRRRRRRRAPARARLRGRGGEPVGRRAEGGEAVPGQQGRFPDRHRQFRLDACGRAARRAQRQADRHHRVVRGFDHRRQMLAERVPRQRSRRAAIGSAGCVAIEGEAQGEGVLSRPGLRDGPFHRRGLQVERGTRRGPVERRGVRAARFQGLHAVFRADPRRPSAGGLHLGGRQRHRAPAHADAGFRAPAEHDDRRRFGHRHLAEHQRHRQGGGRLRHRRRLLAADRHAREQEVRRRLQGRLQDRSRPLRRRFAMA